MLSTQLRLHGFSADHWLRVLSLLGMSPHEERAQSDAHARGMLVVVEDDHGHACAAFHSELGSVDPQGYVGRADLGTLCERYLARRGVVLRRGAIEELTERAASRVLRERDFAAQWLQLLGTARELTREGLLYFWPERTQVPLPSAAMVKRALDIVLPDEHCFLAVIWEGSEIWTALCIRRRAGEIDWIAGPETILDVTGPLGGDYRRDHRALSRAVGHAIAPVHIGLFAQRDRLESLLRDPHAGAWAKAVALRDIIVDPAPPYVAVAVSADAMRASAKKTGEWLGGIDFLSFLEPVARVVRDQVSQVASVTSLLGWNPLQVLAERLRSRDRQHAE